LVCTFPLSTRTWAGDFPTEFFDRSFFISCATWQILLFQALLDLCRKLRILHLCPQAHHYCRYVSCLVACCRVSFLLLRIVTWFGFGGGCFKFSHLRENHLFLSDPDSVTASVTLCLHLFARCFFLYLNRVCWLLLRSYATFLINLICFV
jgi:hypothetical protein